MFVVAKVREFNHLIENNITEKKTFFTYWTKIPPIFLPFLRIFYQISYLCTMKKVTGIDEFNQFFHQSTSHPMVSVGELSKADLTLFEPMDFDMYCIVLMEIDFGELVRNGKTVRYQEGTIFSLRPGQVVSMNLDYTVKPRGWMLAFRPELLEKSGLGRDFYMFNFFSQDVYEALELSSAERGIILNSFANIFAELRTPKDYLTDHMLRLGIGHLLSYCKRFFERQFAGQTKTNNFFSKLDSMVDNYLSSGSPAQKGQPTVAWCAEQFNLSPNYFGEIVKKELYITAQEYLQGKILNAAKSLLTETNMTIYEISEQLGFSYSNHFARFFRKKTGMSPIDYRRGDMRYV